MAYENSALVTGFPLHMTPVPSFDKIIAVKCDDEWVGVADPEHALHVLMDDWLKTEGPSRTRALAACAACLEGNGSPLAARAAFSVAVMEAGFSFELFDDHMSFLDFQLAVATAEDVRAAGNQSDET